MSAIDAYFKRMRSILSKEKRIAQSNKVALFELTDHLRDEVAHVVRGLETKMAGLRIELAVASVQRPSGVRWPVVRPTVADGEGEIVPASPLYSQVASTPGAVGTAGATSTQVKKGGETTEVTQERPKVSTKKVRKRRNRRRAWLILLREEVGSTDGTSFKSKLASIEDRIEARVKTVRGTGGGVALEVATKADMLAIKSSGIFKECGLVAEEPRGIPPRIRILDVPKGWSAEYLVKEIHRKNISDVGSLDEVRAKTRVIARLGKGEEVAVVLVVPAT